MERNETPTMSRRHPCPSCTCPPSDRPGVRPETADTFGGSLAVTGRVSTSGIVQACVPDDGAPIDVVIGHPDLGENRGTSGRTSGRIVTSDGVCGHGGDSTGSITSNVPPDGHVDACKLADGIDSTSIGATPITTPSTSSQIS